MLLATDEKNNETIYKFNFLSINKELYNKFMETNIICNGGRPSMRLKCIANAIKN